MMRRKGMKLITLLLAALMLVAVMPVSMALAAGTIPVTVTASKATVAPGENVTFTVSIGNAAGTNLAGFAFTLTIPSNLALVESSAEIAAAFKTATPKWTPAFDGPHNSTLTKYQFSDVYFDGSDGSTGLPDGGVYNGGSIDVAVFTCTATAAGSATVTLGDVGFYDQAAEVGQDSAVNMAGTVLPATINIVVPDPTTVGSVTGSVASYNPKNRVTATLTKIGDSSQVYTGFIEPEDDTGPKTQTFEIGNVAPGAYTLEISKNYHTSFKKTTVNVVAGTSTTVDAVTLVPGDLDGNGSISSIDLGMLLSDYNKSGSGIPADLDGNLSVSSADLGILLSGYLKSSVTVP